ncbi:hypothetical protein D9M71_658050 [compost metagenome]
MELQLGLVTLVGIGTIGITHIRRSIALGTGEQVLAILVLAVHQREKLLLQGRQLVGVGIAISIGKGSIAGADRQFVDPLQDATNRAQGAFSGTKGITQIGGVARVLLEHALLLLKLQQTCGAHRVVLAGAHTNAIAGLLLALHAIGEGALIVGTAGVVKLRSRNAYAHDLRLLKDC